MNRSIVPHDPAWTDAFSDEANAVGTALKHVQVAIHHIGSTAIPGVLAKPIIDLLCVVTSLEELDRVSGRMEGLGYEVMGAYGIEGRRYFRKSDASGRRTHHLHAFKAGSHHIERHLAFRDYLRSHPQKAAEYSALKDALINGSLRASYQDGKVPFIAATQAEAVEWYRRTQLL